MHASKPFKMVCPLLIAALATLLVLSSQALPPLVRVEDVRTLDDGSTARVYGVVVAMFRWDSGDTRLLLADHETGSTVEVLAEPAGSPAPMQSLRIGDRVLVEGRTAGSGSAYRIFTTDDGIELLAQAEHALTVDYLCDNWRLFEYDRFNISGTIHRSAAFTEDRLMSPSSGRSIRIVLPPEGHVEDSGTQVTVDCTLQVDLDTMTLFLRAWSLDTGNR